ncbi:transposon-encoded TnpW family protein [[Clostridium] innocuum]|nr:transposon-encoded TnpW family protein [[Clostridium] innocuum]
MEARTHDGKPCRVSEMQIGTTLFTVISVESADAKESAYDKVKKLIINNINSPAKVCVDYYQKV